ncbi:MAG: DUF1592 domain-containing protein [Planctomycetaceae bacterium]|nr:DUF1592 domain-containing protein [Planctomycetaceae bacterium]
MNAMSASQVLRYSLLLVVVISSGSLHTDNAVATERDKKKTDVGKFTRTFCADCHGTEVQEGERSFSQFKLPIKTVAQLITADEIIDQLTLKSMPPAAASQPDDQQRVKLITDLREAIAAARGRFNSTGGRTVIRRLSNREYENTLAVLFNRRVDTLGLTADFPKDGTSNHIDTIGETLVTSGFLLDEYFQAASRMVDLRLGKPPTEEKQWHFTNNFRQYEELSGSHKSVFNYNFLCLYEQPNTDTRQGGYGHIEDFLVGVPVSGLYDIEVNAQALHRDTHYDPKIFRIDFSEPFQIGVVPGDVTKGHIHYPQSVEPLLGKAIVPDDGPEWLTFRVWLEAGQTPRFIFPNGPYESRASVIATNQRYKDEFKNPTGGVSRATLLREGALPHIRIGEIKIRGPIPEPGGSKEEIAVFGDSGFQANKALPQLAEFARKAFRRPLTDSDRQRIERFYNGLLAKDMIARDAALATVKMILCSPSFLYFSEITKDADATLQPHDLATRLSYTLWAAPPDQQLHELANKKLLQTKPQLTTQIERLVNDPRSIAFVRGFLDSWLNLRDLGDQPPPRKTANEFYAENLPHSMKRETQLFFQNLLEQNGSIMDFLNAEYTFVDKQLAKLYQLPNRETLRQSDGFQKVELTENQRRGGLLGMASVLTVSANGVDTSPVTRGAWILENILGTPSPPPPDEVPSIDSDVSGATTIREKLSIHREDEAYNICHRNIDPLGFPLENFDPIGRWRSKYSASNGQPSSPIDPSGQLTTGESFANFAEFKRVLTETRGDVFARSLIESLLAYSTGRNMQRLDQYEIDDILARVKAKDYGLRTAVTEVLTSDIFRSR